ncbi:MAG: OmpA family protein [Gammaproteobacteria bacterium]
MQSLIKLTRMFGLTAVCMLMLTACIPNQNVKGAYPPTAPAYAQGAGIGAVTGAAITGINGGSMPLGIAVGALLGGSIGAYRDDTGAIKQLAAEGITVIRLGDIVEVVIPHDIVFDPETYDIKRSAHSLLNQIVALLVQYKDVNMSVVGHSDNVGTDADQQTRSSLQAEAIMSYLWSHGIALNRLNFYGVGPTDTDASMNYANGQSYNRRVVIMFWRQGPPSPLNPLFTQSPDCWTKADPDDCQDL